MSRKGCVVSELSRTAAVSELPRIGASELRRFGISSPEKPPSNVAPEKPLPDCTREAPLHITTHPTRQRNLLTPFLTRTRLRILANARGSDGRLPIRRLHLNGGNGNGGKSVDWVLGQKLRDYSQMRATRILDSAKRSTSEYSIRLIRFTSPPVKGLIIAM